MGIRPSVPSMRLMIPRGGGKKGEAARKSSNSSPSSPATGQNDITKYILHEEWLADVCGVSRRRLTIRNEGEQRPARPCQSLTDDSIEEELPTQEELDSWSKSFDKLMRDSRGRQLFLAFLQSEYSEENLYFWLACEELKDEIDPKRIEEKVRLIYDDFISILSPREVSLDGRARDVINLNMSHPDQHTFDDAQVQIYTLMQRDSYPRFLGSSTFRALVEQ